MKPAEIAAPALSLAAGHAASPAQLSGAQPSGTQLPGAQASGAQIAGARASATGRMAVGILLAVSAGHLLNDLMQSMIPAIYPILKAEFVLSFTEIGLIQLCFQLTASLLQPAVGLFTDRRPQPFSLVLGMGLTFVGLLILSVASVYPALLLAVALVGMGSSIFHPEASRVARMASGGRHGAAQSVFQVGGNLGSAIGPLLAAIVVISRGQASVAWFSLAALLGMVLLAMVGRWYREQQRAPKPAGVSRPAPFPRALVQRALVVLVALTFAKNVYTASLSSYYTFYLIETFGVSVRDAQLYLFAYLGAVAVGTIAGGPLGDRFGRRAVLWGSIVGPLPFTLLLPYVGLGWTCAFTIIIGLMMSSAFPAILVYAQELLPGKVGLVSGIFFGLAFGLGGIGAAVLGLIADRASIGVVYQLSALLPLLGLLIVALPDLHEARPAAAR
ncbi:MFS transporter [Roseomonas sp. BN140053]|uniref:MFS transporter n=1 Tax=Roseomonas sp. BN140053 TaxID=3391898 RepID=UPI0039EA648D